MAETKKELMFDPQWMDMNYEKYYLVPWPDSQYSDDAKEDDDIIRVEGGVFVSLRWICEDEEKENGPEYD